MVFSSSSPVFLDPPNWQQIISTHDHQGNGNQNPDHQIQLPSLPPYHNHGQVEGRGTSSGSIRPGSMADRARLAKIPHPESSLKCPRCESTNTKFCYFNNYNLSQPRHFCKTCRRYWTRGGSLRNVPVGGGCRRNKKNRRRTRSRSPPPPAAATAATDGSAQSVREIPTELGQMDRLHLPNFMASLHQYGGLGLNLCTDQMQAADHDHDHGNITNSSMDHWRLQQFSNNLLNGSYPFQSGGVDKAASGFGTITSSSSRVSTDQQLPPVRFEGRNLSKSHLGISESSNNQYWGGNSWTQLTGLSSSSSRTHLL